jgi:recombinational DNA repair ATPase RecF
MFMKKSDLGAHLSSLRTWKKQIEEQIRQDRHSTVDELHQKFPQISRSLLNEILRKHLEYKKNVQGTRDKFLDHIFTGDQTWVSHFIR